MEVRLDGGVARRNDRGRSGVTIEAVAGVLACANQTHPAGDNLVSMNGAEEDGVENGVDAPSRGPGEGPVGSQAGDGPDGNEPAVASTARVPAAGGGGQAFGQEPLKRSEAAVTRPNPVINPAGKPSPPASGPASSGSGPASSGSPTVPASPAPGPSAPLRPLAGDPDSPSLMAPPPATNGGGSAQAALTGAANSARGLAAKVGSSFSGITKPKPKGKPKPRPQARRPGPGGPQVDGAIRSPQATRPQPAGQQTRSALLSLQRIEPMSVMKFSFLISLVAWVVIFVAVAIIYYTLSKLHVFTKIEQTVGLVTYNKDHPGSNAASWFRASRVLEYTALVCTINAILFTALATVGAALYNLVTALTGGIEVTLKESD
jgi:hypothetical protein